MTPWKTFRHRLEELGCQALAWAIPKLSRRRAVRLGQVLGALAWRLDGRGRAVALENLRCAFGEGLSPQRRAAIGRASYENFVRTMLDLFWARCLRPQNYARFIEAEGFEAVREQMAREKRGAIFLCVHQGNWEWASLACGFLGFGNTVVAENFKNPRLTALFCALRQHSGQTIIAQENSLLRLLRIAMRGGATGMLLDLNLRPTQAATVIEGFGMKMCVPLLHAVLAQRAGALLVPVETVPSPDGRCRVVAHAPVEIDPAWDTARIAQRCWEVVEPWIKARPELWLWAYKHFRYRPRAAARPYPEYANESARFEKLLRSLPGEAVDKTRQPTLHSRP